MRNAILITTLVASAAFLLLIGCSSAPAAAPQAKPAASAPAAQPAAPAGKVTVLKMAHPDPLDHPMHLAFEQFKSEVEQKSNGALKVEIYGNMALGDDNAITQGVQTGAIQMGTSSTPNLAQFTDAFYLLDLPFLFPNEAAADKILDGPIGQQLITKLEAKGIKGLAYTEIGYRHLFNNKKPISTLDDVKGLKIRATGSPVHIANLKALGANATPMGWGEVYTGLQQGVVDGIDIDINLAWTSRFQEVQKYLTLYGATYSPHLLMINKALFDGMPADQQKIITDAAQNMKLYERKLIRDNEADMLGKMKSAGMQVTELSPTELQKWRDATKSVYSDFESRIGKELIQQVQQAVGQ